jgi:hypothetical protein
MKIVVKGKSSYCEEDINKIVNLALARPKIQDALKGKTVEQIVIVPNKTINIVTD